MTNITKVAKPLVPVPFSRSRVDIIIPFHAQYEKVVSLIESILISVKSNPYQITLVDDCSDNENFHQEINDQFKKKAVEGFRPQVVCVRNEKQLGFGASLKVGYENTNLPWLLFMHSDCVVEDANFMIEMGQSLFDWREENVPVKMVSARSNNPGDCVKAKANIEEKSDKNIVLENETLPLFCSMCHRELFDHIRGFIKSYPYAWYEDEELSHRMRKFGFKQGISTKAWIKHEGSSTIKYLWSKNPQAKEIMENNRELCLNDIKKL
jgi:glycosyltransferase involved in cell wall biosynthesis